jgi:hypothetical protein
LERPSLWALTGGPKVWCREAIMDNTWSYAIGALVFIIVLVVLLRVLGVI